MCEIYLHSIHKFVYICIVKVDKQTITKITIQKYK
nr:MAG TPA: hypothetical protein [Caudoviricetes sp.]